MIILGMDLGPHWLFIVAAYALALAVVLGLIAWVVLDHRIQARTLRDLEARGLRRRSSSAGPPR
jgi:heme exporter protein D